MHRVVTDPHFQTFGQSGSCWSLQCHEGVAITPEKSGDVLTLYLSGTRGANWQGALQYAPFEVCMGEILEVSFTARAVHPVTFSVWLGQRDAPYQSLVSEENHFGEAWLTKEWKSFTHQWRVISSEPAARLNFVLAQIDNTVALKDVHLHCIERSTSC